MASGAPVRPGFPVRRNGVVVQNAATGLFLWWDVALTKRGARRSYAQAMDGWLLNADLGGVRPGEDLRIYRIERRRIVDSQRIRLPEDGPPDAGVREPRRTPPAAGGAAAAVQPDI